jgi:hypothetical protein
MWASFEKKNPKLNNHPMAEYFPDLVTLPASGKPIISFFALRFYR